MTLRLPEHWIWDFWFAQDGDEVMVQRVGLATSDDLVS
jgi:hypothetical protein